MTGEVRTGGREDWRSKDWGKRGLEKYVLGEGRTVEVRTGERDDWRSKDWGKR